MFVLITTATFASLHWNKTQEPQPAKHDDVISTCETIGQPEAKTPEIEKTEVFEKKPLAKLVSIKAAEKKKPKVKYDVKPIPEFLDKSIKWLADAQFENGGWGAGQNSAQNIRDPRAVQTDPATTAFAAMALLRSGSNIKEGPYSENVRKALEYLLLAVENAAENDISITKLQGTQPQSKLGQNIDVSVTLQFLSKILPETSDNKKLENRINAAMDKCIGKLEKEQLADGSWNTSGWAPVLNSAMANTALEYGNKAGRKVKKDVLERSQQYQAGNYDDKSGGIVSDRAAGISLYAYSSTQRATAQDAQEVEALIKENASISAAPPPAVSENEVPDEEATYDYLRQSFSEEKARKLAKSYTANKAASKSLQNDEVLSGFGNNGGEEYLSYAMTSESLVASGDKNGWNEWHSKMENRLQRIQNQDGSWSGHHCITSPVFCTAAVVMTLTADRDTDLLAAKSK